ncbi:Hypothetical predicted protein [Mytilus galloprovincialis]|uniref:Exonuclease domain-containing protein n=1 Tax=Mytilus galloprovincialis TaxID=29158 RepID=A0A8B6GHS2_MYTGA|nr:Hypothetical predicted protein [Mytilus galloprovincialis]
MGKLKSGFNSSRNKMKLQAIRKGQLRRTFCRNLELDHPYASNFRKPHSTPDISNVIHEEIVDADFINITPDTDEWRKGRRVIELGVLADNLDCKLCGLPLHLKHAVKINDCGLGSILKIMCMNRNCNHLNNVPTGKRHGRIWDINSKVALAAIHIGLGEHQLNAFLSILNMPTVSHKMFDQRSKEVGEVLESLAEESMVEWTEKEKTLTKECGGDENITVCVDAGWQKRGSGRAYDSLTGHCSMIGSKSRKIIGYKWRSKTCRICEVASKKGKIAKIHQCRKNFGGSAKAMEPDMVTDLVREARLKGTNICTIVGDEDSTTIARLRSNVDKDIKKLSDSNHMKKTLGKKLYDLKNKHQSLSTKVINYVIKCFNFLVAQGKGQPEKICKSLPALAKHPFGDHSDCHTDWCRFIEETGMKYRSLPYGKPLSDKSLQASLQQIFSSYAEHSNKLANLESTQGNESFNKTVASKAPKSKHYGGSGSLGYRIAASVVQKNRGQIYTVDANVSAGLSPGVHTKKLFTLRDLQAKKRKAIAVTKKAKLHRIQLKSKRHQNTSSCEVREGVCYEESTALGIEPDITEIPAPVQTVTNQSMPPNLCRIYFDIEATGLSRTSHILQLSAKRDEEMYNSFVLPSCQVTQKAAEITGITFENGQLLFKGNVMPAVGHNICNYDCMVLYTALEKCSLLDKFMTSISGFVDTLLLFKSAHPGLSSYSQPNLFQTLLGQTYDAHRADEDVDALFTLVNKTVVDNCHFEKTYLSKKFISEKYLSMKELLKNLPSLKLLVDNKILSISMARIIAKSGLSLQHLKLAFTRNGAKGIRDIFTESSGSGVRVTKSQKI